MVDNVVDIKSVDDYKVAFDGGFSGASLFDGEKFLGGLGSVESVELDYWSLRERSDELFKKNIYARGIVDRLVTNEINTGLTPECYPLEPILGLADNSLLDWTEVVEARFGVWCKTPKMCDHYQLKTFGQIQAEARREAIIGGDCLVIIRQNKATKLPNVEIINGRKIQSGLKSNGANIIDGVELDKNGRQVAYHYIDDKSKSHRIAKYGNKTGRLNAFLLYGCQVRSGCVRGEPLLSVALQSIKELDRYRDAAQRKAAINAVLAIFIKKSQDKPSSLPLTGGAVRRDSASVSTSEGERDFKINGMLPGLMLESLNAGEEPMAFGSQGTDINLGDFERVIISALAWCFQIPPEILTLSFSSNYSASQAAINEFKIYLNKAWSDFGENFCQNIYRDYLLSAVLKGDIKADGYLKAYRDPEKIETVSAWENCDWYGSIKPSTDTFKQARGSKILVDEAWSTNEREARNISGTKFSKNIKKLKRENLLKAEALEPMLILKERYGAQNVDVSAKDFDEIIEAD